MAAGFLGNLFGALDATSWDNGVENWILWHRGSLLWLGLKTYAAHAQKRADWMTLGNRSWDTPPRGWQRAMHNKGRDEVGMICKNPGSVHDFTAEAAVTANESRERVQMQCLP